MISIQIMLTTVNQGQSKSIETQQRKGMLPLETEVGLLRYRQAKILAKRAGQRHSRKAVVLQGLFHYSVLSRKSYEERKITMKKFVAFILAMVMVFACVVSAMAAPLRQGYKFDVSTTSTTEFKTGCSGMSKTENKWYISLNAGISNLSSTHRAVARVHHGYDAASATYVYSGPSTTVHGYNADCQGFMSGLSFRARLDNRDTGTLEFHGTFYTYMDPDS